MHFSIPDTQEFLNEVTGSTTYTGYNIYINGSYHCCLRYKQLHSMHEQLRRQIQHLETPLGDGLALPVFPSKKLLPLTNTQVEQRRAALEHYLQLIGQVPALAKLELFQTFLLNAQQESAAALAALAGRELPLECCIDVLLMNGYQIQLQCRSNDNASTLLRKACQCINLPPDFVHFFCIYLIRKDVKDTLVLLRRLMDFESPVISQQTASSPCQLMLRKSYWNPSYDLQLMRDSIGLNLLFIQTISDVDREWIIATPEMRKQLHKLQEQGKKREYMELARQLPLYGCLQFMASNVDYPAEEQAMSSVLIAIGNKELSMRTFQGAKIYETKFRVTRMRCWRVTAVHHNDPEDNGTPTAPPSNLQLSFEYLLSRQTLRWITVTSAQAMLMSVCLQSMVDELLQQKEAPSGHTSVPSPSLVQPTLVPAPPLSYVLRDGSGSQTICASPAYATNELISASYSTPTQGKFFAQRRKVKPRTTSSTSSTNPTLSAYSSTSPIVFFRNAQESMHNEAFEGIGDDDL